MKLELKRRIIQNRHEKPLFIKLDNASDRFINILTASFINLESSMDTAWAVKTEKYGIDKIELPSYDQFSINIDNIIEYQYVIDELSVILGTNNITRLRLGLLAPHGNIPTHIDVRDNDSFIIIISGAHDFIFRDSEETTVTMNTKEAYYINAYWNHTVENNNNLPRIALLGEFNNELL